MVGRIAIAGSDEFAGTGDFESDLVFSYRHNAAFLVVHLHDDHRDILSVGGDLLPVYGKSNRGRGASSLAARGKGELAVLVAARLQHARGVYDIQRQMLIFLHLLRAEALSVEEEFDFIHIGVNPNGDFLAFVSGPVPVRKEMEHRPLRPPGLVIEECVLGKAADVDDAILRADVRPAIGRGLTAIIKAGPDEAASEPFLRIAKTPPPFGRGATGGGVRIVGADEALRGIGDIDATRAHGAYGFRTDYWPVRMSLVICRSLRVLIVVSNHIADSEAAGTDGSC